MNIKDNTTNNTTITARTTLFFRKSSNGVHDSTHDFLYAKSSGLMRCLFAFKGSYNKLSMKTEE